jgi:hypothetical protein
MSASHITFLVNVPALSPASFPDAPSGVKFLNPGVPAPEAGTAGDPAAFADVWFRPRNLPMDERTVKAMLAQFAQLARESKSLGDISAFFPGQYENFHSGTSFAIKDEIIAAVSGREKDDLSAKAVQKAQTALCLAWSLEQSSHELAGLETKLDAQWSAFEKTLGLEEDDALEGPETGLAGGKPDLAPGGPRVPVAVLMESVLAFLPEEAGLYCADENLLAMWEEFGAAFAPADTGLLSSLGLEGGYRAACMPGYLTCLSKRPDPAKPWLDAARLIVAPGGA